MISFFARNGVAANLLMAGILIAGAVTLYTKRIPLEVFPEFDSRSISVSVPYRGATPEEVEESIVIRIEEAISDVEGIEQILSSAGESGGTVTIEVDEDFDRRDVLDEVKARVDGIPDFPPGDAENATVRLADSNRWVIGVVLYGDMSEYDLRKMGEQVRDEITNLPDVSGAELQGVLAGVPRQRGRVRAVLGAGLERAQRGLAGAGGLGPIPGGAELEPPRLEHAHRVRHHVSERPEPEPAIIEFEEPVVAVKKASAKSKKATKKKTTTTAKKAPAKKPASKTPKKS